VERSEKKIKIMFNLVQEEQLISVSVKLLLNRQILQREWKISWRKCFDKHF